MKRAMLSQPMAGKTDDEIKETREKAIKTLENKGYEIVNTLFTDEWYSKEKNIDTDEIYIRDILTFGLAESLLDQEIRDFFTEDGIYYEFLVKIMEQ